MLVGQLILAYHQLPLATARKTPEELVDVFRAASAGKNRETEHGALSFIDVLGSAKKTK